ncbi:hypothetical protein SO802_029084 [Lithocarpus litseifolius]|uniref:Uncharacterized protein n=1 Tax=Lithocarpus litseifolius TaxID=425828 RepID=A0AAW2BXS0_9ROSI
MGEISRGGSDSEQTVEAITTLIAVEMARRFFTATSILQGYSLWMITLMTFIASMVQWEIEGLRGCMIRRQLHTVSSSHEGPSETLKRRIAGLQRTRKSKKNLKIKKDQFIVEVPESKSYLDTASLPMILTVVGVGLFAKLLMMYDDSKSQELIERKIKNAPDGQGTVRMLSREEWEEIREVRPRTPFESKLARPNAKIRTGERLRKEDLKDWTIDVLTDALTRVEETARQSSK